MPEDHPGDAAALQRGRDGHTLVRFGATSRDIAAALYEMPVSLTHDHEHDPHRQMSSVARRVLGPPARLVKRLARPLTSRLHARTVLWSRQATDSRFENLEHHVSTLGRDVEGLERYMPAVLNAIASQNAFNRANVRSEEEIGAMLHAVLAHFDAAVETITERRGEPGLSTFVEAKILHPDRVRPQSGGLRLNIGCGHLPLAGYVNIDAQPFDEVDVVADPRNLPFDPGSVGEIRAEHLLHRFSRRELREAVLPHWLSLLEDGATLAVVATDSEAMIRSFVATELSFEELADRTFGRSDPARTMFSAASLTQLFAEAGLQELRVCRVGWPEVTYDIEVAGRYATPSPSA